jgi:phosphoadenosine phosphosulfate reductase
MIPSTHAAAPPSSPLDPSFDERLATLDARDRILAAVEQFGDGLIVTTSFGIQAAVMLHLIASHAPGIAVVFIDTGFMFPETYRYADQLAKDLQLDLRYYTSHWSAARIQALHGPLWEKGAEGLDRYNDLVKVEPMNRALNELKAKAWLSGLRRSQSSTRQTLRFAEKQRGIVKIHPILDWTDEQVGDYFEQHQLPPHPLAYQGYASVGDTHSSKPLAEGMTAEQSRFNGLKRECGLHERACLNYEI